jgi:nitrite reductase/ring-hydroxylating ferredoxin subunit
VKSFNFHFSIFNCKAVLSCAVLLLLLTVTGCGKLEEEYSNRYRCHFTFNNSIHNNGKVLAAVNSWGTFVHITLTGANGIRLQLYGQDAEVVQAVASEQPERFSLGIDNSSGLFIGCSTLHDGALYAFDGQCPNCYTGGMTAYRLEFSQSGQWVTCPSCHRSYDINNGGIVISGEAGNKLYRYRASYNGNILVVNN